MENEWVVRGVLFVVMVGSGALLCWMGQAAAAGRLKRNHLAGIRIPSTMVSDEGWLAAHIRARRPTLYAGIVAAASGALALFPLSMPVITVGVMVAAVVILALVLYGARVGGKAADSVSRQDRGRGTGSSC